MKLRNLFMAVIAGAAALVACEQLEELGLADLSVDQAEISLPAEESSATIGLVATRDWMVSGELPEWITLSATSGEASSKPQTITVTVLENKGNDRETTINFTIGLKKASVLVKQAGAMGEIKKGSGTKDDPYTVAGVIAFVESLGADVQSDKVYVKGVVSEVATTFAASGNYGNATFYIKDSADAEQKFYVFQTYYLGNRQWKSGDTEIKVGDQVIIYGPVVNYKGNTPETAGKGASFIYSLNDKSDGGDEPVNEGTAKGKGTLEEPYNPAGAAAFAKSLGADVQSDKVYIKGKVSKVGTTFEASGTYGNATFNIVDAEDGTGDFYVFQTYYLGNRQWKSGDTEIKVGDIVIIYGPVVNYKGNTPETAGKGASFIYSLNGKTEGGNGENPPADETQADPAGDGTEASPFNVSAAINKAKEVGKTATEQDFYVKGKVSKVSEQFSAAYGNGTFELVDEGFTAVFTAYRILYLGNKKWEEGDATVAVGDELVAVGKIVNYNEKTPEITQGGYLYSLNGNTSIAQGPVFKVENEEIRVSAAATEAEIKVKGNVQWTVTRAQATTDVTAGEGEGTIKVTFAANEDTENEKVYAFLLTTTANVERKQIEVKIIQGKAGAAGTYEVQWLKDQLAGAADKGAVNKMDEVISFKNSTSYSGSVTELRIYKGQTLTVTAASGYVIEDIEIGCSASGTEKYGPGCFTASPEGYTYNDKQGRWAGSASEVVFTAGSNQVRIVDLKVHYKAQ